MAVNDEPRVAADYQPGCARIIRQTCLEIATRLGDFRDRMCVVGGLVPSLIIDQRQLPQNESVHVGTIDLDLGFSIAVLDEQLYEEIAKRLDVIGRLRTSQGWALLNRPVELLGVVPHWAGVSQGLSSLVGAA